MILFPASGRTQRLGSHYTGSRIKRGRTVAIVEDNEGELFPASRLYAHEPESVLPGGRTGYSELSMAEGRIKEGK